MRALLYKWNNYFADIVTELLTSYGIEYDEFSWQFDDYENDEAFEKWFRDNISGADYDFTLSINYWPLISTMSREKCLKYISWCYDCPLNVMNPELTLGNDNNYVFMFDRKQCSDYEDLGIDRVYHLPLGFNERAAREFHYLSDKLQKYETQISLVGSLYESQLPLILSGVNNDTRSIFNELVHAQEDRYDINIINECIDDEIVEYINSQYESITPEGTEAFRVSRKALIYATFAEVTRRNRLTILNLLGRRYSTDLYSFQSFDKLDGVNQRGQVDYRTEMPYVFRASKISLNPVLRCIETGIPLRAFDIMGYGGLLFSSFQPELAEEYRDGEDCVIYNSYEEALDKAAFYLSHEDIRQRIVKNGYDKTVRNHTLGKCFDRILRTARVI
ncbi:MAG: DUF3880 domain-containing protein [Lachnospiraceae bacterium]|nr:DUF3880 domain-containing protein [Lachnospiraceae bacterium]